MDLNNKKNCEFHSREKNTSVILYVVMLYNYLLDIRRYIFFM